MYSLHNTNEGFTLIELIVSISIFAFMTAFLVGKFGNYNHTVLVTNAAYDVALTIRSAQSYGLNVRGVDNNNFSVAYGAHFQPLSATFYIYSVPSNGSDLSFGNSNKLIIATSTIQKGVRVDSICDGMDENNCNTISGETLDVVFKRPNPDAKIFQCDVSSNCVSAKYAQIVLRAADGSMKTVAVRSTGQIAIQN